ncbi:AAEL005890-PA [Aedes aegypti]|uniref:AAEL005890-PA n=2 Tax=Aedes aegypti TaxID=7159 RepID=A0A1S4FC58_AEDAE|nr:heat shock protein 67B2 [Aedes aegypti]EAT42597.1 AAEL005890-PA [Aedes aegypti]
MSLNCLRIAAQRVRAGSRIVQNAGNVRSYNVAVGKVTPISACYHHHSIRSSDKFQGYPLELRGAHRCYSEQCPENKYDPNCIDFRQVATYDEIVDLPNHPEVLLIDVRRPDELAGTGTIPTSINIPLDIVEEELKLAPKQFESKYGRPKPAYDSPIIFSCRSGIRAGNAAYIADTLGFTNVKNYVGSWLDYAEKNGLPQEPQENKFY